MVKDSKPKENYQHDPKRRKLARIYFKQKLIMGIGNNFVIPIIALSILYFSGALVYLANFATQTAGTIGGIILFVFLINIIFTAITFPLSLYGSHYYEHKYKLSNQTLKQWFVDYAKNLGIGYVFSVPLESITAYLVITTPNWWLIVTGITILFEIFINYIYPTVIFPITYKFKPYTDKKELKVLLDICKNAGIKNLKRIIVAIESEKSQKVNAWMGGIGKTKTMTLYDNLLNKFTKREVRTIIGHEAGHYAHNDTWKGIALSGVISLVSLYSVDKVIRSVFSISSTQGISLYLYPIISGAIVVLGFFIMPIQHTISRRVEMAADTFALEHVRDPLAQISSEKRLDDLDLGNDSPHPFIEFWFLTHPCSKRRIENVRNWMKANNIKG